ncbi:hypothetical protein EG68_07170 [Paragonimus skrjabini miyazakii]|uniref:RB1-inducible coiled-coil protein 1 n=1 Tax=Paragonimus skrjabini miyazakii TaxID=59628 RepID=A0A8S9YFL8_9TREM|nr:hypothetical protein EG68_07170 [Paragonimus skrjabini miyazakii]
MYVFLMDKGQLVHLDSKRLSQNVSSLRAVLAEEVGLPWEKQILLVSGGFQLEPGDKLSECGAGMDKTNPIYVFTRTQEDDDLGQMPDVLQVNDGGFPRQIETLLNAPPSLTALNDRICAVRALAPIAHETCEAVKQLVSEQREMVQGWCVALANLAEVAADTNKRLTVALGRIEQFEKRAGEWERQLSLVDKLKAELSQVPLLTQLINPLNETCNPNDSPDTLSPRPPSNLYEWVCLQSALSSGWSPTQRTALPTAARLQLAEFYLNRPGLSQVGRCRTTSAGHLDNTVTTSPQPSDRASLHGAPTKSTTIFGSERSFGNLFALCTSSPSLTRSRLAPENINSQAESAFLAVVDSARRDFNLLRYGVEVIGDVYKVEEGSEMNYVRRLTTHLAELLSLVSPSSSTTVCMPAGSLSLDPSTVEQTHQCLDHGYFSELLFHANPLTEEALRLVELIDEVNQNLTKAYQHACASKTKSSISDHFGTHTLQLKELLAAFRKLCQILSEIMQSKMNLAENLRERQRWLQNFQSDIHRLDASIQKYLSRMNRITRTGTLLSQLQKAPEVYARSLVEVVRQHEFDVTLAQLAREQRESRSEEMNRRRLFAKQMRDNILHSLFALWTCQRGDRCGISRTTSHGIARAFSTMDTQEEAYSRLGVTTHTRTTPKLSDSQPDTRRSSLGSRSEPKLNELIHQPINTFRLSSRTRPTDTLRSIGQRLTEVNEDDIVEQRTSEMTFSSATPSRSKHFSGTDSVGFCGHTTVHPRAQPQRAGDDYRRASIPTGGTDGLRVPKWTLGDHVGTEEDLTLTNDTHTYQNMCITREDLDQLALVLPAHLATLVREEVLRALGTGQPPTSFSTSPPSCASSRPVTQHVGLSPMRRSIDDSRQSDHVVSTSVCSVACQTELPIAFHSPARTWIMSGRQSSSLVLPITRSPQRTLPSWEPLPSSLCSWEFCPGSPVRLGLKRSVSTSAVMDFTSTLVKYTQTDDAPDSVNGSILKAASAELPDVLPVPTMSSSNTTAAPVSHPVAPLPLPEPSDKLGDSSPVTSLCGELTCLDLDPVPSDELYTEPEFATPTTMMSSSFHSTRTNLSNPDEPRTDLEYFPLDGTAADYESVNNTPVQHRSRLLVDRGVESSFSSSHPVSTETGPWASCESGLQPMVSCGCNLNRLHATCLALSHQFSRLPLRPPSADHNVAHPSCSVSDNQMDTLNQILIGLSSYVQLFPHPPCSLHASLRSSNSSESTAVPELPSVRFGVTVTSSSTTNSSDQQWNSVGTQTACPDATLDACTSITLDPIMTATSPMSGSMDLSEVKHDTIQSSHMLPYGTDLVALRLPAFGMPSPVTLTSPLSLSSVKVLERFITFAHSNFTYNDTVVFVPVRGSSQHATSPTDPSSGESTGKDRSSPPNLLRSISPASSMLSSTIIKSMEISSTANCLSQPPRNRDVMYSSGYPSARPKSRSNLVRDLFESTMDGVLDSSIYPSTMSGDVIPSGPHKSSKVSTNAESTVTQWRMLSSDGHVYFLHQDDFSDLNLDTRVDYCKLVSRSPQNGASGRSRQYPDLPPGASQGSNSMQPRVPTNQSASESRSYLWLQAISGKSGAYRNVNTTVLTYPKTSHSIAFGLNL